MEVEIVKWNKLKLDMIPIEHNKYKNIEEAHNYYTNWMCEENTKDNYFVTGKNWNHFLKKREEKTPKNYKYVYTYSINLLGQDVDMEHSHNFEVFKKEINKD